MKKILIIISVLIFSTTAYADSLNNNDKKRLAGLNKWLFENEHYELVEKAESEVCKQQPKYSNLWYYNKCDKPQFKNNLKIKFYGGWIPEKATGVNYDTLLFQLYNWTYSPFRDKPIAKKYEVKPSSKPYKFKSNLQEDKYIDKQLNKTGLISYLRFEDGKISIDKFTPEDRFGKFINKKTKLRANSVGKTMASYVVGHAICGGYIDSVNTKLNDWPLLENTLYYDQKLIDILNMNSGDQEYIFNLGDEFRNVGSVSTEFKGSDDYAIDFKKYMSYFKNTKKSKPYFNYSGINPQLALNYVLFKTGNDFEKILEKTFKKKSKIEDSVFFFKVPKSSAEKGDANIMFYATRYDYLRIGKAMLDDWQKDTCVGKYLKTLFENRISKETKKRENEGRSSQYPYARGYAGQFQTNYEGINKNRAVMGMHGYGGQRIVIDFERSRIIVTNALFENYNYKKIVYQVIKKGS
tara:strand:+ start:135 stop:1529 length:1395 start_codon:yes stop_codon:yes gene_type:complete